MERFVSVSGDTYISNVIRITNGSVVMDNYSVWYYGESLPYESNNSGDSAQFFIDN